MEYVPRQPISGVPRIRFSSCSVVGWVLASRVACFVYGHHICAPPQLAFGGDDHRCCERMITPLKIKNLAVFDAGTTS